MRLISYKTNFPFTHYTWYDRKCIKMSWKQRLQRQLCSRLPSVPQQQKKEKKRRCRVKTRLTKQTIYTEEFLSGSDFSTYIFHFLHSSQRPQNTMKAGHRQTRQTHADERRFEAFRVDFMADKEPQIDCPLVTVSLTLNVHWHKGNTERQKSTRY